MAFGWAGAGAGASNALEDILKEQMVRAQMLQREKEAAAQMQLQRDQLAETTRVHDADIKAQGVQADRLAAQDRDRNNVKGVRRMIGDSLMQRTGPMTPEDRRSIAAMQVEAGDLPDMSLLSEPAKKMRSVTTVGPNGRPLNRMVPEDEAVEEYREPKAPPAGPKEPKFVRMPDGSVKDINNVAPPGAVPFDAVADRQQAAASASTDRALQAMRTYGDDMTAVINELIDENGNLKPDVAGVIGGFDGARPEWAYASEGSQNALAKIDRLQSMLDINKLNDLKTQSRTGATGFGALNEKELGIIESSGSTLRKRRQAEGVYAAELKRLRDTIKAGRTPTINAAPPAPAGGLGGVSLVWDGTKFVKPGGM